MSYDVGMTGVMKQHKEAHFWETRDAGNTMECIVFKKPVHQIAENISPTKQSQICKCFAISYTRTNRCNSTLDAQLPQKTSYSSAQGQKHKEST